MSEHPLLTTDRPDPVAATGHFKPATGWVGDVIPFEHDGVVWLYYLLDERDGVPRSERDEGMPWAAVTTTDFVRFDDRGVVLPSGGRAAEDFDCYTGSVVTDDDGLLHLFYTGHNPAVRTVDGDLQIVCHATSDADPAVWVKHPEWSFGATAGHVPQDWRDPFVYRTAPGEPWQMLLAARVADGTPRRSGVVARLESDDLVRWRPVAPLWNPRRFITQECPDLFQWGSWWYLVYSEFSDSFQTRYRVARSPEGPWLAPRHDTVDGRAFYASKTVASGDERMFIGWIATKEGDADAGAWQWAGTLSVLAARQREDGSLAFRLPDAVGSLFPDSVDLTGSFVALDGADSEPGAGAADRYAAWLGPQLPDEALVTVDLEITEGTHACGVLLRASDDGEFGYEVRLEPSRGRLVLDQWPRGRTGGEQWQIEGDRPHAIELERPVDLAPGVHRLQIHLDHTLCVIVVDDQVALSTRLYDHAAGRVGVFCCDGEIRLVAAELRQR